MKKILSLFCLFSLLPFLSFAKEYANQSLLNDTDYTFATKAATGGLFEVAAGELAKMQASSARVKKFAEQMVAEHYKAAATLNAIAVTNKVTLPLEPSRKQQEELEGLKRLKGEEFDVKFAAWMVMEHEKDLKLFQEAAEQSANPELKSFARETAEMVERHLRMAKEIKEVHDARKR